MTNTTVEKQGRQGDVFLVRIDKIPAAAKERKIKGNVVVAQGTATGNHHMFPAGSVKVFDETVGTNLVSYIRIPKGGATLSHQEHGGIPYCAADYIVINQVENLAGIVAPVQD